MKSPRLTVVMLECAGACSGAIGEFEKQYPNQKSVSIKKLLPRLTEKHPIWLEWCFRNPTLTRLFIKAGVDPNMEQSCGCTALHIAVEEDNIQTAKVLLEEGAEVNPPSYKNAGGVTPLNFAYTNVMTDLLLKYGAKTKDQLEDAEEQQQK